MEPSEIWGMVFELIRKAFPNPTIWLAMRAVKPLTIDGNYFIAALSEQDEYMASSLLDHQTSTAIEDALQQITGRILAFRLIKGETLADWELEKAQESVSPTPEPVPTTQEKSVPIPPQSSADSGRVVSPTWEKLTERLNLGYKSAPFVKYPHGQAQFVLSAVKSISDTMDLLLPPPGGQRDDAQERALAKVIERLGSVVNLDPLFLSLELLRYRESQGIGHELKL